MFLLKSDKKEKSLYISLNLNNDMISLQDTSSIKQTTALTERGLVLLQQIRDAYATHHGLAEHGIIVGGLACVLYTAPEYRSKTLETDIDMIWSGEMPDAIRGQLQVDHLIESQCTRQTLAGIVETIVKNPNKPVYRLTCGEKWLDSIDLFYETQGWLKLPENVGYNEISIPEHGMTVRVASKGLLLASILNEHAFTEKRGKRARYLLQSMKPEEYQTVLNECVDTLKQSGATQADFDKAYKFADRIRKGNPVFRNFCIEVYQRLDKYAAQAKQ